MTIFKKSNLLILLILCLSSMVISCAQPQEKTQLPSKASGNFDLFNKYQLDKINLPEGFIISVYAEVPNARSLAISDSGTIFVGNRNGNKVYAVRDTDGDGYAESVYTLASGLQMPNGVAFKNGSLYIATVTSVLRIDSVEKHLSNPSAPVTVFDGYPADQHHGWKFIAFGPDNRLYVPVGAPCNVCEKSNPLYSSITSMNADGTGLEVFASGIRNTVGFTWHPVHSNQLWFTDNGRDMMGNDMPADELNMASKTGMHFGFPYCHQGNVPDPEFGKGKSCAEFTAPVQNLGPHVAALGLRFYTGNIFPEKYKHQIFIAEHGSWNRTDPIGYRVTQVTLNAEGKALSYSIFADGWLQQDGTILGRPVDLLNMPDGSMLLSDDYSGVIYRISYKGNSKN